MELHELWLVDFRSYVEAAITFAPGLTAIVGDNGRGKTNILEAVGYLATLSSFRGAPTEALVRAGAERAVVRAQGERDGRSLLVEAEIVPNGRSRVMVNRQRLPRARDLLGALRTTVFAPDDLALVKGGPGERRRYLDDLLVASAPRNDALRSDIERILRQRNALLRQAGGRLTSDVATTLEVWDAKLVEAGEEWGARRADLVAGLSPLLGTAYDRVAHCPCAVTISYQAPWRDIGLAAAISDARKDELRRGVSLVGPHRDDVALTVGDLPARSHASQGEQRSLALALRLAGHALVTEATGSAPVLLLDDVFSELDTERSEALVATLPVGQTLLTTAVGLPPGTHADHVLVVEGGTVREARSAS